MTMVAVVDYYLVGRVPSWVGVCQLGGRLPTDGLSKDGRCILQMYSKRMFKLPVFLNS